MNYYSESEVKHNNQEQNLKSVIQYLYFERIQPPWLAVSGRYFDKLLVLDIFNS